MIKTYYALTKPGIIYGNLITATAGFLLASKSQVNLGLLVASLAGISLVIASACVFNNYFDRDIDSKMARTKSRALASGLVSGRNAVIYAIVLGLVGFLILGFYTNALLVLLGLVAFFDYVILYTFLKRYSVWGTLVGSICGAIPIVAGYVAVTNQIDTAAAILFLILVLWQMPHFYAIAIYRLKDYTAASIPVLPVKKGIHFTKINMLFYIVAFTIAAISLTTFGYTGYPYLVVTAILGTIWFGFCLSGFRTDNDTLWARKMFRFSLLLITVLSIMISLGAVLP